MQFRPVHLTRILLVILVSTGTMTSESLQAAPLGLVLPTENRQIFSDPSDYYMYTDRNFEGVQSTPWQGGQYGFVRNQKRTSAGIVFTKFHEGMDIRPARRGDDGNPLDMVHAIATGRVVHVNPSSSGSSYGKYVVVEHNWGHGPFYSLSAHLMTTEVKPGQAVRAGSPLGRLGYTGVGIDRRRAHLHLELNLLLTDRFEKYHDLAYRSPNHHGIYNGLNLAGIDIAGLYRAHEKDPNITLPEFMARMEPYYKVLVPARGANFDFLKRYPWLGKNLSRNAPSYELTLSASGIPLRLESSKRATSDIAVSWVKPSKTYHSYYTRDRLSGSGSNAALTATGKAYIRMLAGMF